MNYVDHENITSNEEISKRRKGFIALCMSLVFALMPTVQVFAVSLDVASLVFKNDYINGDRVLEVNDQIYGSGGYVISTTPNTIGGRIIYLSPSGNTLDIVNEVNDDYTVFHHNIVAKAGYTQWKARAVDPANTTPINSVTIQAIGEEPGGTANTDEQEEEQTPAPIIDLNAIAASYYDKNGQLDHKALFGRVAQGAACQAAFDMSRPKGWNKGFSFSMTNDGKHTNDLKDGKLILYIPGQFQKTGRKYAVLAIDKNGVVHKYDNTGALPFVFTSPLNFEGYAFEMIYTDP